MRTLRLIGRGASDTFEHLIPFAVLSLCWWACVALIVPAPGATLALAALTDPRRSVDRPEWREVVPIVRANLVRGWRLALLTLPFLAVLAANLGSYAGANSRWALLVPLWTLLFVTALAVLLAAVSVAGLLDTPALDSVKLGVLVALRRPFRTLAILVVLGLIVAVGTLLVVPLVMPVPALVAAMVNRFVLGTLGIAVPDPLAPTAEREEEERRRASASRFGP